MNYFLFATTLFLIIYIILTRSKPEKPVLIERCEDDKHMYSIYRHGRKFTFQTMFKADKPELFSVYIHEKQINRITSGKANLNKLYTKPYKGLVHYSKPSDKISKLVKIDNIDIKVNPWSFKDKIDIIAKIRKYYVKNPTGGACHIVLDDGNLEDENIDYCKKECFNRNDFEGMEIMDDLLMLKPKDRESIYEKRIYNIIRGV